MDLDDARLYVERHGSGPPLVTLHGGLGLDHTFFRPYLDPLGESFDVVYFDQRGCGRSTSTYPIDQMTHEKWADDVERLRAALGFDKFTLLGHSYGAFIALEFALRHADRLAGLVLCEVAPIVDYPEVIMRNARERVGSSEAFERVAGNFGRPAVDDSDMEQIWRDIAPAYFFSRDPALGPRISERAQLRAAPYNQSACKLVATFNVLPRLGEIRVPTTILVGRHDFVLPVKEGAERVHAGIPGSELVVFENSGHFPFVEEQTAFLSAVRDFQRRRLT